MLLRLRLFPGYYQRHLWPYNPVNKHIRNCLCTCMFPCVRINDDDDDDDCYISTISRVMMIMMILLMHGGAPQCRVFCSHAEDVETIAVGTEIA